MHTSTTHLIVVSIAERYAGNYCPTQGIHDLSNRHIWSNSSQRDNRVHRKGLAVRVVTVDAVCSSIDVHVLPDAEAVVHERVVHPEDGVTGAGRDIGHGSSNTIVAICVGTKLQATLHVSV